MTPLMTVVSIIGGAFLLVAIAIVLVLRIQCYRARRRKKHKICHQSNVSLNFKLDQNGPGDSDEKNPDVIPLSNTGLNFFLFLFVSISLPPSPLIFSHAFFCDFSPGRKYRKFYQYKKTMHINNRNSFS